MTRKTPASLRVQPALGCPALLPRGSSVGRAVFIQVFLSDGMGFCGAIWNSSPALGVCADGGLRSGERVVSAY